MNHYGMKCFIQVGIIFFLGLVLMILSSDKILYWLLGAIGFASGPALVASWFIKKQHLKNKVDYMVSGVFTISTFGAMGILLSSLLIVISGDVGSGNALALGTIPTLYFLSPFIGPLIGLLAYKFQN